LTKHTFYL